MNFKGDINVTRNITAGDRVSAVGAIGIPDWITGYDYVVGDSIKDSNTYYICSTSHTSGASLAADVASWDNVSVPSSLTQNPLAYAEIGVDSFVDAIIAPMDTIIYESVPGVITTDGVTITVNKTATFTVYAHAAVSGSSPVLDIKVNGTVVKTFNDDSLENRLTPFRYDFTSGDILILENNGGTIINWNNGADLPTTDSNYCRFILEEVPTINNTVMIFGSITITNGNGTAGQSLQSNGDGSATWI